MWLSNPGRAVSDECFDGSGGLSVGAYDSEYQIRAGMRVVGVGHFQSFVRVKAPTKGLTSSWLASGDIMTP
jgi:hypothetical protein